MNVKNYKQKLLDELYKPYIKCMQCPLGGLGRTKVVFGAGNPDSKIMFIGEAPGAKEDELGLPFVGRSGQLLTRALNKLNVQRDDVFITNIVKCRPPNNRLPLPIESTTCKSILLFNQIKIIRPKIICTLGSHALNSLYDKVFQITKCRGKQHEFDGIVVIPTYHPAYVLRNPVSGKHFLEDIKCALELAEMIK
ncbi:uracil-DNA glycosylase [Candidatus Dependentiae bacterium]|nr:uracil-DNA glycosylase [Candidatus Dependentiae bacterium]